MVRKSRGDRKSDCELVTRGFGAQKHRECMPQNGFQLQALLHWLRLLFPKWNFFDRPGLSFSLWTRSSHLEDWKSPLSFKQPRRFGSLFFNPRLNQALAQKTLIEQFCLDLAESDLDPNDKGVVEQLASFRMLSSLARLGHDSPEPTAFQLKIVGQRKNETFEIYESSNLVSEKQ